MESGRQLDVGKLAASFDIDTSWHQPTGRFPEGCYHVLRLGHRLRFLCPPETPCEAWGSLLHILHRAMANCPHQRLRSRLFLKEAKVRCCGGARDEIFVQLISEALLAAGKRPMPKCPRVTHWRSALGDTQRTSPWLLNEETLGTLTVEDLLAETTKDPPSLDISVRDHLRRRLQKNVYGALQRDQFNRKLQVALPIEQGQLRHSSATVSVWRDRLQSWLQSDEGKAWNTRRGEFLTAQDGEESE